jgi:hypothetical protein
MSSVVVMQAKDLDQHVQGVQLLSKVKDIN